MNVQSSNVLLGYFELQRIVPFQKTSCNSKPRLGLCCSKIVEDGFVTIQRTARPVFADLAEEPVFDWIPLGASRRVMANGDGDPEWIA